jgi:signal transduction histidine kinase
MASRAGTRPIKIEILVSLLGVAACTVLIFALREAVPVQGTITVYVLPVLVASVYFGLWFGVATSILSVLAFGYFHLPPENSIALDDWHENAVALAVFLIIATVTAPLAARVRRLGDEQAAVRRVATQVAQADSASEIFESVTREVGLQSGADVARIERYETDGTVTGLAAWSREGDPELVVGTRMTLEGPSIAAKVRDTGQPVRVDSFARASGPIAEEAQSRGIRSSVGCPIVVEGRVWGVIAASSKGEAAFAMDTEARIGEFTELVATAIANAEARDELIASRARIVAAADEARRRIQRDLHDGAQQRLVHTIVTLKLAQRALENDDQDARDVVAEALGHAETATEELRELSHGILPSVLDRGGLRAGVESLVSRISVPVQIQIDDERFPAGTEATAYFVVSESLTNVVKHSGADRAVVTARSDGAVLRIEIRDDGTGGAELRAGSGLAGLHDRVAAADGTMEIESPLGEGTRIVAMLRVPG